jgi:hypothetical protein
MPGFKYVVAFLVACLTILISYGIASTTGSLSMGGQMALGLVFGAAFGAILAYVGNDD